MFAGNGSQDQEEDSMCQETSFPLVGNPCNGSIRDVLGPYEAERLRVKVRAGLIGESYEEERSTDWGHTATGRFTQEAGKRRTLTVRSDFWGAVTRAGAHPTGVVWGTAEPPHPAPGPSGPATRRLV